MPPAAIGPLEVLLFSLADFLKTFLCPILLSYWCLFYCKICLEQQQLWQMEYINHHYKKAVPGLLLYQKDP